MAKYSERSLGKLSTCHHDLQEIFKEVIKRFDNTIIFGYRGEEEQNSAVRDGLSQLSFPNSMHNTNPSMAIDAVPYPIDWKDTARINYFAGFVMGIAFQLKERGIIQNDLRWGGDWDQDTETKDNNFNDLVHFELISRGT